jgi:uncharacterized protein involved in outer membrane biogenesis
MDADVTYHAGSITASKVPMQEVDFHVVLDNGVLTMQPVSFVLDQGTFSGGVIIDAATDTPQTSIDMTIDNVDLSQFKSATAKQPPLQGRVQGRLKVQGAGTSVHKLASNANGTLTFAIPHGQISDTVAELTGINALRALGLLMKNDQQQTEIRCGVVDFQAQNGVLQGKSIFVDTTNVLITGRGNINLDSEKIDLSLQGDPKKLRLVRIRAPISLGGTLLHPGVSIKPEKLMAQAGAATALGVLLTPVGAALALIDPGLAKDKDCAAVMAAAQ